jgi:hypothetical protein
MAPSRRPSHAHDRVLTEGRSGHTGDYPGPGHPPVRRTLGPAAVRVGTDAGLWAPVILCGTCRGGANARRGARRLQCTVDDPRGRTIPIRVIPGHPPLGERVRSWGVGDPPILDTMVWRELRSAGR